VIYTLDKIIVNQTLTSGSITRSAHGINLIDSPYVNTIVIEYLMKKEIYDIALVRFGQGTRKLIEAKKTFSEPDLQHRIREIYKSYCTLSKKLSPHVSIKNKCRFVLFRANFPLYIRLQKALSA
jgi:hypothetical protein